jgi:hypothetical protein
VLEVFVTPDEHHHVPVTYAIVVDVPAALAELSKVLDSAAYPPLANTAPARLVESFLYLAQQTYLF